MNNIREFSSPRNKILQNININFANKKMLNEINYQISSFPMENKNSLDAIFYTPKAGLSNIVRDVKRRSLRRRKLWMNSNSKIMADNCNQRNTLGELSPGERS